MSIKKFIAIVVAALVIYKLVELYLWETPIQIGRDTTYIIEPLDKDGLPNYAQAIDSKAREGVTPENNGAVLAWQTLGPMQIAKEDFSLICADLGIDPTPTGPFLELPKSKTVEARVAEWLEEQYSISRRADNVVLSDEHYAVAAADLIDRLLQQPWTASDCTPMAQWVIANEAHLDRLVESANRPKFYSPPPNLLAKSDDAVVNTLLPLAQGSRDIVRSLLLRANYRMGTGDYAEAWNDVLACWRMGEHLGRGSCLVENFVGIAIRRLAAHATVSVLYSRELPIELAKQIQTDLAGLAPRVDVVSALSFGERLSFLDFAIRALTDRSVEDGVLPDAIDNALQMIDYVTGIIQFDSNEILREGNLVFNELVVVASKDSRKERNIALDAFEESIDLRGSNIKERVRRSIYSRSARSKVMGDALIALLLPASGATIAAADRDEMNLRMLRVASSLAIYRMAHSEFPDSLDALHESARADATDIYSDRRLVYLRRGEGYLLYSVFWNETDDGGDDISEPIVDGEWLPLEKRKEFEAPGMDNSDLVIRVPLPPLPSVEELLEAHVATAKE